MRLQTKDGPVLVMRPQQFDEVVDTTRVLEEAHAASVRAVSDDLREMVRDWRKGLAELDPKDRRRNQALRLVDMLLSEMEFTSQTLAELALEMVPAKGSS